MRGPGLKTAFDVRRLWRCSACAYERRCDGRVTTVHCQCNGRPFMQLVSEPRFARKQNRPLNPYVDADEILGPPEPATTVSVGESPDSGAASAAVAVVVESLNADGVVAADSNNPEAADAANVGQPQSAESRGPRPRRQRGRRTHPPGSKTSPPDAGGS